MVYRIPTHLDSFVPPPSSRVQFGSTASRSHSDRPAYGAGSSSSASGPATPWRGTFVVSGLRQSDMGSSQEIKVVGVEIEGDCQTPSWPLHLFFSLPSNGRPSSSSMTSPGPSSMAHVHAQASRARSQSQSTHVISLDSTRNWVRRYQGQQNPTVSMVSFMPEKVRDPNANVVNQSQFRNVSRILHEANSAAIIPWPTPSGSSQANPTGPTVGGILLYPAPNSSAVLIGVVFLDQPFPDFVTGVSSGPSGHGLSLSMAPTMGGSMPQYQQQMVPTPTPYGPSAHSHGYSSSHSRSGQSHSPITPTIHQRNPYQQQRNQSHSLSPVEQPHTINIPPSPMSHSMYQSSRQGDADAGSQQQFRFGIAPMTVPSLPPMSGRSPYPAPPMMAPLPPMQGSMNPSWTEVKDEEDRYAPGSSSAYGGSSSTGGGHMGGNYGQ